MNYGLIIYGPLEDSHAERQTLSTLVVSAFPVEYRQIAEVWEMLRINPVFNHAQVHHDHPSGDLVIEVYFSPPDPFVADARTFHTRITRQGRSE